MDALSALLEGVPQVAGVGDNEPPIGLRTGSDLTQYIAITHAALFKRADDLIEAESRLPAVVDEATDAKATEYVKLIQACEKGLDQARLNEKAPYDLYASEIHSKFRGFQDKLVRPSKGAPPGLKERIQEKQTTYKLKVAEAERQRREAAAAEARRIEEDARLRREAEERVIREAENQRRLEAEAIERAAKEAARQAELAASRKRSDESRAQAEAQAAEARRIADEAAAARHAQQVKDDEARRIRDEASRKEAEESANARAHAEKAAAATDAELTRSRGARGGISSLTTFWDARDIDRATLDLEALRSHIASDALEVAIRSYMKANKELLDAGHQIAGVTFFKNHRTGGR